MQVSVGDKTVDITTEQAFALRDGIQERDGKTWISLDTVMSTIAAEGLLTIFSGDGAGANALGRLEDTLKSFVAIRSQV